MPADFWEGQAKRHIRPLQWLERRPPWWKYTASRWPEPPPGRVEYLQKALEEQTDRQRACGQTAARRSASSRSSECVRESLARRRCLPVSCSNLEIHAAPQFQVPTAHSHGSGRLPPVSTRFPSPDGGSQQTGFVRRAPGKYQCGEKTQLP